MKFLKKLIVIVVVILIALLVSAFVFMDSIVKTAVNTVVPEITDTNVKLDNINISFIRGNVKLDGLSVANPKGFSAGNIFSLKDVDVKFNLPSLAKKVVVIDKIEVVGAKFNYELMKGKSNIAVLMDTINSKLAKMSDGGKKNSEKVSGKDIASRKVYIKEFIFKDGKVAFAAGITKKEVEMLLDIPNITLKNLGSENNGIALADAVAEAMSVFSASAIRVVASDTAKDFLKGGEGTFDKIKSFFN